MLVIEFFAIVWIYIYINFLVLFYTIFLYVLLENTLLRLICIINDFIVFLFEISVPF
jgi:hypothetical protein